MDHDFDFTTSSRIEIRRGDGLYVQYDTGEGEDAADGRYAYSRGLQELARGISDSVCAWDAESGVEGSFADLTYPTSMRPTALAHLRTVVRRSRTSAVDDMIAKLRGLRDTPAGADYRQPENATFAAGDTRIRFGEPEPGHPSIRTAGYIQRTSDLLTPIRNNFLAPDDQTPFAEHEAERLLAHHRLAVDHVVAALRKARQDADRWDLRHWDGMVPGRR